MGGLSPGLDAVGKGSVVKQSYSALCERVVGIFLRCVVHEVKSIWFFCLPSWRNNH